MFCPNCGGEIKDGSLYCILCGQDIHDIKTDKAKVIDISQTQEFSSSVLKNKENGVSHKTPDSSGGRIPDGRNSVSETPEIAGSQEESYKKREVRVNSGIYKLICICMGLCLIAGSVVWATLMLRDRIDSPVVSSASQQPQDSYISDSNAYTESETPSAETTTATTTATTTTAATTTADPYTQEVVPEVTDDYGTMYVSVDSLFIRCGPGYSYTKLDVSVPSGTALEIQSEQEDIASDETWCYITYEDVSGWVSITSLSETNPTVTVVLPDTYYTGSDRLWMTVIRSGGLKLYSGPGEDYDVLMEIPEGAEIQKEGCNYLSVKWLYTSYNGQYGWVITYDGDWFNPTIE